VEQADKPKRRRSHYQAAARRKLRYADYMGGDGAWLRLSRCGKRWKYWLFDNQYSAMWNSTETCGQECSGQHSIFRLLG
jgi:hypothetical protein